MFVNSIYPNRDEVIEVGNHFSGQTWSIEKKPSMSGVLEECHNFREKLNKNVSVYLCKVLLL